MMPRHQAWEKEALVSTHKEVLDISKAKGMKYEDAFDELIKQKFNNHTFDYIILDAQKNIVRSSTKLKIYNDMSQIELKGTKVFNDWQISNSVGIYVREDRYLFIFSRFPPPTMRRVINFLFKNDQQYFSTVKKFIDGLGFAFFMYFFILFCVLGGVYKFINKLLKNIVRSGDTVIQNIKNGETEQYINEDSSGVLGDIIHSFNQLAIDLQKKIISLKEKESQSKILLQEITHDFKTPISSITSNSENLIAVSKENESIKIGKKINNEAVYIDKLLDDLLFLSELVDWRKSTRTSVFNVEVLINDEIDTLDFKNLDVELNVNSHYELFGSQIHFKRMIRNLLDNSIRYASTKIDINVKKNNNSLEISVIDDGPGFANEDIMKNFGIKSINRNQSKSEKGHLSLGLGSVIVKKIAEQFRGDVQVMNAKPSGAHVLIRIPLNAILKL
jgi:signal transduction histidine kinase